MSGSVTGAETSAAAASGSGGTVKEPGVRTVRDFLEDLKGVFRLRRKFWRARLLSGLSPAAADSPAPPHLESTETPPA